MDRNLLSTESTDGRNTFFHSAFGRRQLVSAVGVLAAALDKDGVIDLHTMLCKEALVIDNNQMHDAHYLSEIGKKRALVAVKLIELINGQATLHYGENVLKPEAVNLMFERGEYPPSLRRFLTFAHEARAALEHIINATILIPSPEDSKLEIHPSIRLSTRNTKDDENKYYDIKQKVHTAMLTPVTSLAELKTRREHYIVDRLAVPKTDEFSDNLIVLDKIAGLPMNSLDDDTIIHKASHISDENLTAAIEAVINCTVDTDTEKLVASGVISVSEAGVTSINLQYVEGAGGVGSSYSSQYGRDVTTAVVNALTVIRAYMHSRISLRELISVKLNGEYEFNDLINLQVGGLAVVESQANIYQNAAHDDAALRPTELAYLIEANDVTLPGFISEFDEPVLNSATAAENKTTAKKKKGKENKMTVDVLDNLLIVEHIGLIGNDLSQIDTLARVSDISNNTSTWITVANASKYFPSSMFKYSFPTLRQIRSMVEHIIFNETRTAPYSSRVDNNDSLSVAFFNEMDVQIKGQRNDVLFRSSLIDQDLAVKKMVRDIRAVDKWNLPITTVMAQIGNQSRAIDKNTVQKMVIQGIVQSADVIAGYTYDPEFTLEPETTFVNYALGARLTAKVYTPELIANNGSGDITVSYIGERETNSDIIINSVQYDIPQSVAVDRFNPMSDKVYMRKDITSRYDSVFELHGEHDGVISVANIYEKERRSAEAVLQGEVDATYGSVAMLTLKGAYPNDDITSDDIPIYRIDSQIVNFDPLGAFAKNTIEHKKFSSDLYLEAGIEESISQSGFKKTHGIYVDYFNRIYTNACGSRCLPLRKVNSNGVEVHKTNIAIKIHSLDRIALTRPALTLSTDGDLYDSRFLFLEGYTFQDMMMMQKEFRCINYSAVIVRQGDIMTRNILYKVTYMFGLAYLFNSAKNLGQVSTSDFFNKVRAQYNAEMDAYGVDIHIKLYVHKSVMDALSALYNHRHMARNRTDFDALIATRNTSATAVADNVRLRDIVTHTDPYMQTPAMIRYSRTDALSRIRRGGNN